MALFRSDVERPGRFIKVAETGELKVLAFPKVTPVLRIESLEEGKRYHRVRGIMQEVRSDQFVDYVTLARADPSEQGMQPIMVKNDNRRGAVSMALHAIEQLHGGPLPASVTVRKAMNEKVSGLGGSSSIPAAAARGLVALHGLDIPIERLAAALAPAGNDIPALIHGGRLDVFMDGNEVGAISRISLDSPIYYIIASPGVRLRSGEMYAELDLARSQGRFMDAAEQNDFAGLVFEKSPLSKVLLDVMRDGSGLLESSVSGKGPAVFAGYGSEESRAMALSRLMTFIHGNEETAEGVRILTALSIT